MAIILGVGKLQFLSKIKISRLFLIALCLIVFFSFNLDKLLASNKASTELSASEIMIKDLPSIVIAYSLFCSRYNEFEPLESKTQNVLIRLRKNIDALDVGISTGMAFTHMVFIVQDNIEGHLSGFVRVKNKNLEESKVPFENILFVTTPVKSFDNRVLVILSSVSPERTTIFAIDNKLKADLLYDSFKKNDIKNIKDIVGSKVIGSIYAIRAMKPGIFLLEERMEPGGRGFVAPYENRTFAIDVTNGSFKILMQSQKKDEKVR